jgi:hypothetical protein
MPISVAEVRRAAGRVKAQTRKSDRTILAEAVEASATSFDIFLSHSFDDRELVVGTKKLIEEAGLSCYVDWIDDAALDRSAIDRARADHLRTRMRQCQTLFYAHTPNSAVSRWCPWELGYFDALKAPDRQFYVLSVVDEEGEYQGQEYLELYDTVDLATYKHAPTRRRRAGAIDSDIVPGAFRVRPGLFGRTIL